MKALQIMDGNRLELVSRNPIKLRPWEARISVAVSLVCGSDIKNINLTESERRIPGHEFSGIVTEVSGQANGILKVGERVTSFPMMPCHGCGSCINRLFRDCENKGFLGSINWPGSFASELIVDARMAIVLSKEISMYQGALLEHLSCGYRLALEIVESDCPKDSRVLIIGDGPIALANLQMLLIHGYHDITIIGKYPYRLKVAKSLGAFKTINVAELGDDDDLEFKKIDICILTASTEKILLKYSNNFSAGALIIEQTRFMDSNLKRYLISCGFKFRRAFSCHLLDFSVVTKLIVAGKVKSEELITSSFRLEEFGLAYPNNLAKYKNIKIAVISDKSLLL